MYNTSCALTSLQRFIGILGFQKPMQRYRQILVVLQKLLDILTGLRKVRENIPRTESVTAVLAQRRDLVCCCCCNGNISLLTF